MKNYIVFDLEWNQAAGGREKSLEDFPFEIIEIGAVRLNENFAVTGEFHRLVRPQVYGKLHPIIAEVTGLDMETLLRDGVDFGEAALDFTEWCGTDSWFCTWGTMDLTELQRNMEYHGMERPFPFPLFYFDIQKLYGLYMGDGRRPSLDVAVKELGLKKSRPFHQALDDAWYTADVFSKIGRSVDLSYISVDYYQLPKNREEEIRLTFPGYTKFVSRPFESKEQAVKDKGVAEMRCFFCGRLLRKKIRWFTPNQKIYYALAVCPEHGYLKGKLRMKKTDGDRVFVVKTLKPADEEGARQIAQRRDSVRKKRVQRMRQRKRENQCQTLRDMDNGSLKA